MTVIRERLNFVIPERRVWPEIRDGETDRISDELLSQRCVGAINNWIVISYIYFRRYGYDATCSHAPIPDAINIASGIDLGIRERSIGSFVVSCRADGPAPEIANYVFEQNKLRADLPNVSWIPHWPQPGLMKRDSHRPPLVRTLAYKGAISNLNIQFRDDAFRQRLAGLGVELRLDGRFTDGTPMRMHDYSNVDAVVAIRNMTAQDVKTKPATKLVNAWIAGVPAFLGPEPGYQELRRAELDYFEIRRPGDLIAGISRLNSEAGLFERMVANGLERAKECSLDAIMKRWTDALNGPVSEAYCRWKRLPVIMKTVRWVSTAAKEKISRRRALYSRTHGRRILEEITEDAV